jgi:hypothetical protein
MSKSGADDALPNVSHQHLEIPASGKLAVDAPAEHRPRILLLYGSLRARSYSRFLAFEAARLLETFGAETRIFDPQGLPLPDGAPDCVVDVMEELVKFTLLTRDRASYLVDRYSERKESAEALSRRVNLPSAVASKETE